MTNSAKIYPDPDANSFFAVGQEFFRDAERQIRMADGVVTNTAYFLMGFALELVLKSYILHAKIKKLGQVYIHDLTILWEWAAQGPESPFFLPVPDWLVQTNNYHLSYVGHYRPLDVSAFVVPGGGHRLQMTLLVEIVQDIVTGLGYRRLTANG